MPSETTYSFGGCKALEELNKISFARETEKRIWRTNSEYLVDAIFDCYVHNEDEYFQRATQVINHIRHILDEWQKELGSRYSDVVCKRYQEELEKSNTTQG